MYVAEINGVSDKPIAFFNYFVSYKSSRVLGSYSSIIFVAYVKLMGDYNDQRINVN